MADEASTEEIAMIARPEIAIESEKSKRYQLQLPIPEDLQNLGLKPSIFTDLPPLSQAREKLYGTLWKLMDLQFHYDRTDGSQNPYYYSSNPIILSHLGVTEEEATELYKEVIAGRKEELQAGGVRVLTTGESWTRGTSEGRPFFIIGSIAATQYPPDYEVVVTSNSVSGSSYKDFIFANIKSIRMAENGNVMVTVINDQGRGEERPINDLEVEQAVAELGKLNGTVIDHLINIRQQKDSNFR